MKIKNMNNDGATLVELMVYMIVGLIVITGALKVISNATGSYIHGQSVAKTQYGARDGAAAMSRDIASMGFKTYFKITNGNAVIETDDVEYFEHIQNGHGDTLEFYRIKINDDGGKKSKERVKYYLDGNNVVRELYKSECPISSDCSPEQTNTIIASNVVALKFRFAERVDTSYWVSSPFPATKDIDGTLKIFKKEDIRNVEISMLVRSPKQESGVYGAATYKINNDYIYDTPDEDRQKVHRLYQSMVEVPNNGR